MRSPQWQISFIDTPCVEDETHMCKLREALLSHHSQAVVQRGQTDLRRSQHRLPPRSVPERRLLFRQQVTPSRIVVRTTSRRASDPSSPDDLDLSQCCYQPTVDNPLHFDQPFLSDQENDFVLRRTK
ncbi:MAG: hypothetical protein Q8P67_05615 [archaeon]|nr:hypothetical protein [archaeon]